VARNCKEVPGKQNVNHKNTEKNKFLRWWFGFVVKKRKQRAEKIQEHSTTQKGLFRSKRKEKWLFSNCQLL